MQHGESFVWVKFRPLDMSPDSLVVLDEYGSLLLLTWVGNQAQQEFIGILKSGTARGTKMLPRYSHCTVLEIILIIWKLIIFPVMKILLFQRCEYSRGLFLYDSYYNFMLNGTIFFFLPELSLSCNFAKRSAVCLNNVILFRASEFNWKELCLVCVWF